MEESKIKYSLYQTRTFEELKELEERVISLQSFFKTNTFNELCGSERYDLRKQLKHMKKYRNVLAHRVSVIKYNNK